MEVIDIGGPTTTKRRRTTKKAPWVPTRTYTKPAIPYAVSQPNRFWRIKKDAPDYWKKRYWRRRITGRGDYRMNPSHSFGRRWGGYLGSKAGEYLGGSVQSILGLGDYSVRSNVFLSGRLPEITNIAGNGGTVIRFQEYLTDVRTAATPDTFKVEDFLINAANERTFPWLSQIAANYEQYEFQGLIFEFKSTSANALNSTNTALGSVLMATQYDTVDTPFSSKAEMLNYEFSSSTKPSGNTLHMIECDPRQTSVSTLFTLSSENTPPNTDPRLYHLGRFQIATTGFQGTNVNIGEIHVTYQVKLLKPKLASTLGQGIDLAIWANSSYSNASPFGPSSTGQFGNNTLNLQNVNGNLMRLASFPTFKQYLVTFSWVGGSTTVTFPTWTFAGASASSLVQQGPVTGQIAQQIVQVYLVAVPANSQLEFSAAGATFPFAPTTQMRMIMAELTASDIVVPI